MTQPRALTPRHAQRAMETQAVVVRVMVRVPRPVRLWMVLLRQRTQRLRLVLPPMPLLRRLMVLGQTPPQLQRQFVEVHYHRTAQQVQAIAPLTTAKALTPHLRQNAVMLRMVPR